MANGLDRKHSLCPGSYLIIDESFLKSWGSLLMFYYSQVKNSKTILLFLFLDFMMELRSQ